jgi:hypothetical protein
MHTLEVQKQLESLWGSKDAGLVRHLYHVDASAFFVTSLLVPPSRFRPPTVFGDQAFQHPQTTLFVGWRRRPRWRVGGGGADNVVATRAQAAIITLNDSIAEKYAAGSDGDVVPLWIELQDKVRVAAGRRTCC